MKEHERTCKEQYRIENYYGGTRKNVVFAIKSVLRI